MNTIFLCEAACFEECHFSFTLQIFLVSDESDDDVGAGECSRIGQPVGECIVCVTTERNYRKYFYIPESQFFYTLRCIVNKPGDVVNKQSSCSASVVASSDGTVNRMHIKLNKNDLGPNSFI